MNQCRSLSVLTNPNLALLRLTSEIEHLNKFKEWGTMHNSVNPYIMALFILRDVRKVEKATAVTKVTAPAVAYEQISAAIDRF